MEWENVIGREWETGGLVNSAVTVFSTFLRQTSLPGISASVKHVDYYLFLGKILSHKWNNDVCRSDLKACDYENDIMYFV